MTALDDVSQTWLKAVHEFWKVY